MAPCESLIYADRGGFMQPRPIAAGGGGNYLRPMHMIDALFSLFSDRSTPLALHGLTDSPNAQVFSDI